MTANFVSTIDFTVESSVNTDTSLFLFGGNNLLRSDGTSNGAISLVNDSSSFELGTEGASTSEQIFFPGFDDQNGTELYISDGTSEGTELLRDINPAGSSNPQGFFSVGETVYFGATDEDGGFGLWNSDGTSEGTQLVVPNINRRLNDAANLNGTLLFRGFDNDRRGFTLSRSDGTPESNEVLLFTNFGIDNFNVVEDNLFFKFGADLWKSDGTSEGTQFVATLNNSNSEYEGINNTLFFSNDDGVNGRELWKSDGTAEGTQLVRDILPEVRVSGVATNLGSNPSNLTDVDGTLFFSADDGVNGRELWKSDGTAEGTQLVRDITEDGDSNLGTFTVSNGLLYFIRVINSSNTEIWQSDGTEENTFRIEPEQISIGGEETTESFLNPSRIEVINDQPYFVGEAFIQEEGEYQDALLSINDTGEGIDDSGSESGNVNDDAGEVVYRFFNNNTGVHFYTASEAERDVVQELDNFSFEGGSYVGVDSLTGEAEPVPVYRFLNQNTGVHLYTISERERDVVQELDNFSFEGEAFSAYESEVEGSIPIYRFFNNTSGAHFYTPSAGERDNVEDNLSDFQSEGIAYYALPLPE